jgi:hypothetical protein
MEQEIKDIISKNLPEQVGTILKDRLHQAEQDAEYIVLLERKLSERDAEIKTLYSTISDYKSMNIHKEHLDRLQEELDKRERAIILEVTNIKLEEAIKRSDATYRLVEHIFRSPVVKKQIMNETFGSYDNQGRYFTSGGTPTHITETTE